MELGARAADRQFNLGCRSLKFNAANALKGAPRGNGRRRGWGYSRGGGGNWRQILLDGPKEHETDGNAASCSLFIKI